jgi:hypothetical protein
MATEDLPTPIIHADDTDENADWIKRGTWDLPTDKAEFLAFLRASGTSVAEFKQFPIYRWHVDEIPWLRDLTDEEDEPDQAAPGISGTR